jgi:type III restriction enzyme
MDQGPHPANEFVNEVRAHVDAWRRGGRTGLTSTSRQLIEYWTDESREKKLFFCQIEALETLMYLTEAAPKTGDFYAQNELTKKTRR